MWAIFIAIFGGLFWAFKIGADKASSNKADAELRTAKKNWDEWNSLVTDDDLESKIHTNLIVPETAKQIKADTLALIRSFHGLECADFNEYYNAKYRDYYVRAMALYVELVQYGKLPALERSEIPNYIELSLDITPSKRARIEFCKWVEETMRAHGVEDARIYYTGKDYASFVWEPYVHDFSTAIRVTDPDLESKMLGLSTEETDLRNSVIIKQKQKETEQG